MKLCPFLVAGQAMTAPQERIGATDSTSSFASPDVDAIIGDSPKPDDLFAGDGSVDTSSFSTSLPARVSTTGDRPITGLECLGDVCRFFRAGGCSFDALFDAQARAAAGSQVIVGTIVDREEGVSTTAPVASSPGVIDEVWSLQRESLREVMNGFQRVEGHLDTHAVRLDGTVGKVTSQVGDVSEQVAAVATQLGKVHSQVSDAATRSAQVAANVGQLGAGVGKVETRIGEVGAQVNQVGMRVDQADAHVGELGSNVGQVGAQVAQVGTSVGRVETQVTKVESQVTSVQASVATVESQVKRVDSQLSNVQTSVAMVASEIHDLRAQLATVELQVRGTGDARSGLEPELLDLIGRHFETLGRDVRQLENVLRGAVGDSVRMVVKDSQSVAQQAVAASEVGIRTAVENLQSSLRSVMQESQEALRGTVGESQNQLGSLLSRVSSETRAQVERGLAKMLEEMGSVREARAQIQAALDGLARETREVAVLARRVESSQVLTHELLDEQRQVTAKLDERERRDRARELNNSGVLSYHQGSFDTSVDRFKQATDLDPSLAEGYNNLGLSYTEMGRDEEATIAFQRALELDPAAAHVYNNLGYLYYRKGDLDHAVEMYQRAIQRGADSSAAFSNLANAYYRLKKIDQAVASWRRALEIDPSNHKAATALERLGLEAHPS